MTQSTYTPPTDTSNEFSQPVEHKEVTPAKLRELLSMRDAATSGDWKVSSPFLQGPEGPSYYNIELSFDYKSHRGTIATVPAKKTEYERSHRALAVRETSIPTAYHDAWLITEAVNWLKPMAEALLAPHQLTETAWLIEWPEDKYNVTRYFAGGEQAVRSPNDATRFCRQQDAQAVAREFKATGHRIVEHKWLPLRSPPSKAEV